MSVTLSTDYTGRSVDLCLFPSLMSFATPADMELSSFPKVIAGPSKAAQGFIILLFTRLGELPERPDVGTNFFSRMTLGSVRYPSDVHQAFLIEGSKAMDAWNDLSASRPLDEQIKSVDLADLSFNQTGISLTVELTTKGGDSIVFLLPVKRNV